ncbi:MAG: ABC-2 type transport system permease protein [Clostridium sp.]|jgi:ABC-2 type transport system permease protein
MFNLVKYELRATFLTILGICTTVIIANLLLMTKKGSWEPTGIVGLSMCLAIGAIIVIFISSMKIMSKYLHEDSGYLLFTLPQSGMSIITSRLITSLIQISIVSLVSFLMFYLNIPDEILSYFKDLKLAVIVYNIFSSTWATMYFLMLIYFCMVIGKVALKGKKLGKIGSFIIFIILSLGISWLSLKLTTLFPQTINLGGSSIANNFGASNSGFSLSVDAPIINIASAIFDIIIFIGFFVTTSYLIDKKLDLS